LTKYATISVPTGVKNILEKAKGKEEWGKFILNLYTETQRQKKQKSLQRTDRNPHRRRSKNHKRIQQRVQEEIHMLIPDADLLIAATAIAYNVALETKDEHFQRLKPRFKAKIDSKNHERRSFIDL
jgi:hypothetical protein